MKESSIFNLKQCNGSIRDCPLVVHCGRHDQSHDRQPFSPFFCYPDSVDCEGFIGDKEIVTPCIGGEL